MYKEVEHYLHRSYEKMKHGQYSIVENKKILTMLMQFLEIGLLSESEYEIWYQRLGGIYAQPITAMDLSARAVHCLVFSNVKSWGNLRDRLLAEDERRGILRIRNLGQKTAQEIIKEAVRCQVITEEEAGKCHLS